jgi:hypothetical protein
MRDVNASALVRTTFSVADPTAYNRLTLRTRHDDGFVAYLNGVEVARRNAPADVAWDSAATASRTFAEVLAVEDIDISAQLTDLRAGTNVLAIQGLNVSAADADFLVLPELVATMISTVSTDRFFSDPTPGGPNGTGVVGFVDDTQFSVDRGFFTDPFDVVITTPTLGATIAYTTNGSEPSLTNGTVVPPATPESPGEATVHIAQTTPLRARAFKLDHDPTDIDTQTYIFLSDVLAQNTTTAVARGFPSSWLPNTVVDYQVDPDVTTNPLYAPTFTDDLQTIPTVSVVADLDNLFGQTNGVYSNSAARGDDWERPASFEYIDPDNPYVEGDTIAAYQESAGLRAFGGVGRGVGEPKHSLRLIFREEYGAPSAQFPFFTDTAVDDHNSFVLKMNWNYSWNGDSVAAGGMGDDNADYLRDAYARATARDMGLPVAHSRPVHLYLNGLYWGLYHFVERTDEQWAAEYFGDTEDDYDILKPPSESFANVPLEIVAGDRVAWEQLLAAAAQNLAVQTNYEAVANLVDVDALIDYMLVVFHTGSRDGPTLLGGNTVPRNFWTIRNRNGGKFVFLAWDLEWALENETIDRVNVNYGAGANNPGWLFDRMIANPDFKIRVADRVQKHYFNGGALSRDVTMARYQTLANEIDRAIIGESARWGDQNRPATPYTRADWLIEVNRLVNTYLNVRHANVLAQLRGDGIAGAKQLITSVSAPNYLVDGQPQFGGTVTAGAQLSFTDPNQQPGVIYYTLDGSDPRLAPSEVGSILLFDETAPAKAFVPKAANGGDQLGDTWKGAAVNEPFDDSAWLASATGAGVGYDLTTTPPAIDYNPLISINVGSEMTTAPTNTSVFIRVPFTMADQASIDALDRLKLRLKFEDGFVAYLNGVEVARLLAAAGTPAWNATAQFNRADTSAINFFDFSITAGTAASLLRVGTNILAIHGLNRSATDGDCLFVPQLEATRRDVSPSAIEYTGPIALLESTPVDARVKIGVTWSGLTETLYTVEMPLRVTELNYHPAPPTTAEMDEGFFDDDDFEFAEVTNISPTATVDLDGVKFTDGIQFTFGSRSLAPGEHVLVVRNQAAFEFRYGTGINIAGQYGLTPDDVILSNDGENVTLEDRGGGLIQTFRYEDNWYRSTDGDGYSLVITDATGDVATWSQATAWRASHELGGSPGERDVILGDLDFDDDVDLRDIALLQSRLGQSTTAGRVFGDLDRSGTVTRADVAHFVGRFGRSYVPPAAPSPSPTPSLVLTARRSTEARRPLAPAAVDEGLPSLAANEVLTATRRRLRSAR